METLEEGLLFYPRKTRSALLILSLFVCLPLMSSSQDPVRVIEIHADRYAFSPAEITLKKGESVTLRLVSGDVAHSLIIPGLRINQPITKAHPVELTLTPESSGDYGGKCGRFCGSGHGTMLFTVHVKE